MTIYHQTSCPCSNNNIKNNNVINANSIQNNPRTTILERNQSIATASASVNRWWQINWFCSKNNNSSNNQRRSRGDPTDHQTIEVQQKQNNHKRASSMSSSENYSSSRSDSWRQNHPCGIPLRILDPKRRTSSWLMTRKSSQESNHSSSGSGTTASTRMSRSSASLDLNSLRSTRTKPRLTRQLAIQEPDSPGSPGRLAVRLLATIPSAAEMSEQCDEESVALNDPNNEDDDEDRAKNS